MAAFDGLRALAVVAVVAYHASLAQVPGGFFGVDVFFVISGYLVTVLFLARASTTAGGVPHPDGRGLFDFWWRRLTRLVPASVATVLLTWLIFTLLFVRDPMALSSEAIAALAYGANWFFIYSNQSYFETIATPSPFLHFWSLAVEAQFYLVWPLILIASLRFGGRLAAFAMAVSLAAVSTLVVASLYTPTTDPSRAYFGTDARVAGLLLGAALAIVVRPALAQRAPRVPVEIAGWAGVVILFWLTTSVSEFDPFLYHGGFFVASTAAVGALFAAIHGGNSLAWLLSLTPLRWLGERAYSIYLWHWPVFVLSQPETSADLQSWSLLLARLGVTLVLADLSYRLVESYFRSGARGRRLPRFEVGSGPLLHRPWARPAGILTVALAAVAVSGGLPVRAGLANETAHLAATQAPLPVAVELLADPAAATYSPVFPGAGAFAEVASGAVFETIGAEVRWQAVAATHLSDNATTGASRPLPAGVATVAASIFGGPVSPESIARDFDLVRPPHSEASPASAVAASASQPPPSPALAREAAGVAPSSAIADEEVSSAVASSGGIETAPGIPTAALPAVTPDPAALGASVTVIGDSVTLGALDALTRALPGAVVDAEVGRQYWSTPAVIEDLAGRGALGEVVVLHLGANGPFTSQQFERIMSLLADRTVVFVNITVPRRWEADVNQGLAARTAGQDRISLVDWNGHSQGVEGIFVADGVHLTPAGHSVYATLVAEAVIAAIASRD